MQQPQQQPLHQIPVQNHNQPSSPSTRLIENVRQQVRSKRPWQTNDNLKCFGITHRMPVLHLSRFQHLKVCSLLMQPVHSPSNLTQHLKQLQTQSDACLRQSLGHDVRAQSRIPVARHRHQGLCLDWVEHKSVGKPLVERLLVFFRSQTVHPELD